MSSKKDLYDSHDPKLIKDLIRTISSPVFSLHGCSTGQLSAERRCLSRSFIYLSHPLKPTTIAVSGLLNVTF